MVKSVDTADLKSAEGNFLRVRIPLPAPQYICRPSLSLWKINYKDVLKQRLDIYVWAISHFGTAWSHVLTNVKLED